VWIVPPVVCAMAIVIAFLPPANPIADEKASFEHGESPWMPIVLTMATLAMLGFALRAVFVA
jgi:hypothetical protein